MFDVKAWKREKVCCAHTSDAHEIEETENKKVYDAKNLPEEE